MAITLDDRAFYLRIISLLNDVKLVHSPEGLASTLRRHPKIKNFLTEYQKREILDIERNL